jgi:hypothetical protein
MTARWLTRVDLTDTELGAVITALNFALICEGEVFIDEDGHDDDEQVAAASELLGRLLTRRRRSSAN